METNRYKVPQLSITALTRPTSERLLRAQGHAMQQQNIGSSETPVGDKTEFTEKFLSTEPAQSAVVSRRTARLRDRLIHYDELLEGRRTKLLISSILFQSVLAPTLDRAIRSVRDVEALAQVARSARQISFAGLGPTSLLGALCTIAITCLILGGRLATFATDSGAEGRREALKELRVLFLTELKLLRNRSLPATLAALGFATYATAITLRDVSRLTRWAAWEGPLAWFGLQESPLAAPFVMMYSVENALEVVSLLTALLLTIALVFWVLGRPVPPRTATIRSLRAFNATPPRVEVQSQDARSDLADHFNGDSVRRCLDCLAAWQPEELPNSEKNLQLALYEHLRAAGFQVGFEEQLGDRNRIDLTLDGTIAVELKLGSLRANERNRVIGQSTVYAARWQGRGPLFVVCVGTPTERLDEISKAAHRWNQHLAKHDAEPDQLQAPVVIVEQVGVASSIQSKHSTSHPNSTHTIG
jgi:hypothetical protein